MEVELRRSPGQDVPVLAKQIMDAVDAAAREGRSSAAIARAAGMTPQQLSNLRRDVAADPEHVIKSDVAERLAAAIGMRWVLERDEGARGGP